MSTIIVIVGALLIGLLMIVNGIYKMFYKIPPTTDPQWLRYVMIAFSVALILGGVMVAWYGVKRLISRIKYPELYK